MTELVNLQLPREAVEFLQELANELTTQDNRATANPRFYVIEEHERVYCFPGDSKFVWCNPEEEDPYEPTDEWEGLEMCQHPEDYLAEKGWYKVYYNTITRRRNAFLTEKAAERYIAADRHNLNNPQWYLDYAKKNGELRQLLEILPLFKKGGPYGVVE